MRAHTHMGRLHASTGCRLSCCAGAVLRWSCGDSDLNDAWLALGSLPSVGARSGSRFRCPRLATRGRPTARRLLELPPPEVDALGRPTWPVTASEVRCACCLTDALLPV